MSEWNAEYDNVRRCSCGKPLEGCPYCGCLMFNSGISYTPDGRFIDRDFSRRWCRFCRQSYGVGRHNSSCDCEDCKGHRG